MRRFFLLLVGFCVIAAGFFSGFSADAFRPGQKPDVLAQQIRLIPGRVARALRPLPARASRQDGTLPLQETYADVLRVLRANYYSANGADRAAAFAAAPSSTKLTYAAIRGSLRTLGDPYTVFWTPDEFARQMEDTRGDFGGIGARLDVNEKKQVYITEPIPDAPAVRKGVQRGDIIVAVDGRPVHSLSVSSIVSRIRGKEGTIVRLTLERAGRTFDVAIERAIIQSPIVKARMQDPETGIGYIALEQFNEQADEQFQRHLSQLEKKNMKALIFDLRGNPGGLLNIAQDLASRFVPSGKIVIVQERNGRESSLDVERNKQQSRALAGGKYPVVVLVNGGSASASEIVSGAIKDHRVGTLIGTTTYGKGLVQTIIPVSGDAAVKVTTQRYFTPNHIDINKKMDETGKQISGGITPDIEVKVTDADTEAMQKAYKADPDDTRHDPQLNKAVSVLKDQLSGKLPRPVATGSDTTAQTARR